METPRHTQPPNSSSSHRSAFGRLTELVDRYKSQVQKYGLPNTTPQPKEPPSYAQVATPEPVNDVFIKNSMQSSGFLLNMKTTDTNVISPKVPVDKTTVQTPSADAGSALEVIAPCKDYANYDEWLMSQFGTSKHLPEDVMHFVKNVLRIHARSDVLSYKNWDNHLFWMAYFDKIGVDKNDFYVHHRHSIIYLLTLWELLETTDGDNDDYPLNIFFHKWEKVFEKYKGKIRDFVELKPPAYREEPSEKLRYAYPDTNPHRHKSDGSKASYRTTPPAIDIPKSICTIDSKHRKPLRPNKGSHVLGDRGVSAAHYLHRHPDRAKLPDLHRQSHHGHHHASSLRSDSSSVSSRSQRSSHHSFYSKASQASKRSSLPKWDGFDDEVDDPYGPDFYSFNSKQKSRSGRCKPAKSRAKCDKTTWDGKHATFRPFMNAVDGHLFQVGAGYILDKKFKEHYLKDGKVYVESRDFWEEHRVSIPQAKYDITYLFGLLLTAMKSLDHVCIIQNQDTKDGPKAWYTLKETYDHNGNIEIRVRELEEFINVQYATQRDGLIGDFLDGVQAKIAQLAILSPDEYGFKRNRKVLLKTIEHVQGIRDLYQTCIKEITWDYQECGNYLRKEAGRRAYIDKPTHGIHNVIDVSPPEMNMEAATHLFHTMAQDGGIIPTYNAFNMKKVRESLSIPDAIWIQMEPPLRIKINEIRQKIRAKKAALQPAPSPVPNPPSDKSAETATKTTSESTNRPNTRSQKAIPDQYPNMKPKPAVVNLCNTIEHLAMTSVDSDGYSTDEDALISHIKMVKTSKVSVPPADDDSTDDEMPLLVDRAHNHAASDSPADNSSDDECVPPLKGKPDYDSDSSADETASKKVVITQKLYNKLVARRRRRKARTNDRLRTNKHKPKTHNQRDLASPTTTDKEEPILCRAHLEYCVDSPKVYAIADGGADSSVVGRNSHIESHTGRHAHLVGFDPLNQVPTKVPIVTALVKAICSFRDYPVVLRIHEAPYNHDSPVTLLSEYQLREHGTVVDSVAKKHKHVNGTHGTQQLYLNDVVSINFEDRGGVNGFSIAPI